MDRRRRHEPISSSNSDGYNDISDLYARYLEPFSPPDQNNDFFFPASPEGNQLFEDSAFPGTLPESLSSDLLRGNPSWSESSADPLYPEPQLHCPLKEDLPQDGGLQSVGRWAGHLQSEDHDDPSARLPIGQSLLDSRFIDDLGSGEGHTQGPSWVPSSDTWQNQSTPCLTNLDYARSRSRCFQKTDLSYLEPLTEELPQNGDFHSAEGWTPDPTSHLQSEEHDDSSLSYSKPVVDHTPLSARLTAGHSLVDPRFIDDLGSEEGHTQGASWALSSDTWQNQSTLCLTNLDYARNGTHYPHDTGLSRLGHSEPGFPEVPSTSFFVPEVEVSKEELQGSEDDYDLGPLKKTRSSPGGRDRGPNSWEFLMRLLAHDSYNSSLIKWEDEDNHVFRLVNPSKIAQMWTSRRTQDNEPNKNNFARNLRYYYQSGVMISVREKQFVYKCGEEAVRFYRNLISS